MSMTLMFVINGIRLMMRVRQLPTIDFCVYVAKITDASE